MSLDRFTFGQNPCQVNLAIILDEINNKKMARYLSRLHNRVCRQIKSLNEISDTEVRQQLTDMLIQYWYNKIDGMRTKLPDVVYRHFKCSVSAIIRDFLRGRHNVPD